MDKTNKEKWTIKQILCLFGAAALVLGVLAYVTYLAYFYETSEGEAKKAYKNGDVTIVQLSVASKYTVENKHTKTADGTSQASNKYRMTLGQGEAKKTTEVTEDTYKRYAVGDTLTAEIPTIIHCRYMFVDGNMVKSLDGYFSGFWTAVSPHRSRCYHV